MILVSQPDFGPAESAAAQKVLESQWVGMGPQTERFEAALSRFIGVSHVVATNSCTAALHLALAALEDDGRKEVIVPSLTFAATIQAVVMAGYEPVFAEVESDSLTPDTEHVARLLGPRTRAVVPVHFAGQPCDMAGLEQLTAGRNIAVVADGAHAFGSTSRGAVVGAQGTATCFSFSSNKNISCGEGGALVTNSESLAARARQMRFLGINQHTWARRNEQKPWHYAVSEPGYRYHMSDINAAIGLAQLERLDTFTRRRRQIAATYDEALRGLPWLKAVTRDLDQIIPNLYVMRVTHGLRDDLHAALRAAGIGCGVHYVPNHQQPAFARFSRPLPVTEQLASEVISLPLHTRLSEAQVGHIIAETRQFLQNAKPKHDTEPGLITAA